MSRHKDNQKDETELITKENLMYEMKKRQGDIQQQEKEEEKIV